MSANKNFISLIKDCQSIGIFSHINPDGDAVCSCIALQKWIESTFNKKSKICIAGEIGKLYAPFVKLSKIEKPETFDLAICLDCPNSFRLGENESAFLSSPNTVAIDHHVGGKIFAETNIIDINAASTTEILFELFKSQGTEVSDLVAMLLYTGIITDTNCFTQEADDHLHIVVGQLLRKKFNYEKVKQYFFVNNSKAKILLMEKALKSMEFALRDRVCSMNLTLNNFKSSKANFEDTMGFIGNAISISTVEVAIITIERQKNFFYVSIRTKGEVNAASIATAFNGGGHKNMAAFQYSGDIKFLKPTLLTVIKKELSINGNKAKRSTKNNFEFL
ncbi:MAG: bifunctional oligoribonuclease/PAP phosphatase NrnA [Clostridia bacterium]